jgi:hypothetical protein
MCHALCDPPPCSIEGQMPAGQKHNVPKPGGPNFPKTNILFNIYLIFVFVIMFYLFIFCILAQTPNAVFLSINYL